MKLRDLRGSILSLLVFAALWEIMGRFQVVPHEFSTPSEIFLKFIELTVSFELVVHTAVTLYELAVGFALAVAIGVPLGLLMGRVRTLEYALDPYLTILLSLPKIVIWPIILFTMGIGITSKIFFGFLLGVTPLIVNTMNGVKNVEPLLLDVAKGFSTGRSDMIRKIVLPAAFPNIMAGLRIAFGRSVTGVVLAEVFGSLVGIGRMVSDAGELFQFDAVFVGTIVVSLIGLLGSEAITVFTKKIMPWARV